jgi:hypothetical protein
MKKSVGNKLLITILVLVSISLLSIGFVSAGWFGDAWNKITGKVTYTTTNNNVALNKPATEYAPSASGNVAYRAAPSKAVDGNINTWWATGNYNPASLNLDLQAEYLINNYTIMCGGVAGGNKGMIQFFNAAGTQVGVKNYTCVGGATRVISGVINPSIRVKTVRVDAMSPAGGDWINIVELQLIETTTVCNPECSGKTCGDNGCGGSCGTCASGQTCTNGACVSSKTCTDSDGGNKPYILGEVYSSDWGTSAKDGCVTPSLLRELYCSNINTPTSQDYECNCKDGACINQTVTSTCIDSDGGRNIYVKGNVNGIFNGEQKNVNDFCIQMKNGQYPFKWDTNWYSGSNTSYFFDYNAKLYPSCEKDCAIYEFACENLSSNTNFNTLVINCPNGCKYGACVKQKITGITGNLNSYSQKQNINLIVKGVEDDGTSASSDEGWNIQYYTYDINNNITFLQNSGYNGVYKNGYWYLDYNVPSNSGSYFTEEVVSQLAKV